MDFADFTKFFQRKVKTTVSGIASTFAGEGVNLYSSTQLCIYAFMHLLF